MKQFPIIRRNIRRDSKLKNNKINFNTKKIGDIKFLSDTKYKNMDSSGKSENIDVIIRLHREKETININLKNFSISIKQFKGIIIQNNEFKKIIQNINENDLIIYSFNEKCFLSDGEILSSYNFIGVITFILFIDRNPDSYNPLNILRLSVMNYLKTDFCKFLNSHNKFKYAVNKILKNTVGKEIETINNIKTYTIKKLEDVIKNNIETIQKNPKHSLYQILQDEIDIEKYYKSNEYKEISKPIYIDVDVYFGKNKNPVTVSAFVDTGARKSLISVQFLKSNNYMNNVKYLKKNENTDVIGETGTIGTRVMEFGYKNKIFSIECDIVDYNINGLESDLYIGVDVLRKYNSILKFQPKDFLITMGEWEEDINIDDNRNPEDKETCDIELKLQNKDTKKLETLTFNIDTGSDVGIIHISDVIKLGYKDRIITSEFSINHTWGGDITPIGKIKLNIEGYFAYFEVYPDNQFTNILGCDFIRKNKMIINFEKKQVSWINSKKFELK